MNIRLYKNEDRRKWNNYVEKSNLSTFYHNIAWKDVIEKSFGHKTYYLLSENNHGVIVGISPLVYLNSLLFGSYIVSMPYFNYGGICADNDIIYDQLLKESIQIAVRKNVKHIEFRDTKHFNIKLPVKTSKVSMRLELPSSSEKLWKSFPCKLRSQIRRPQKEGMYVKVGREDELDSFYNVFSINMRDLGTPVYPKRFFRNILEYFSKTVWICTVYKAEEPVASGFLAGFKETLEIPWASSVGKYNRYSPNMILYWSSMEFACKNGYSVFDFGRSTPGEGTYNFKKQWGARPVQLYWHYWLKNGIPLPELNPKNPKYQTAIKIWKKLPVSLTKLIGPYIVKNLP